MKRNDTSEAAFRSQKRCLEKWDAQQRDWEGLASRLAARANKSVDNVLYNTSHHWREKVEELDMLQASVPQAAKATESGWEMSLRDSGGDGVRFVKFGSDYPYALYCPIKNSDNQPPDSNVFMRVITQHSASSLQRNTMKENSAYFQSREKQYSKHVAKRYPHLQHNPDNELLCVIGQPPPYTTEKVEETVSAPIQQYKLVSDEKDSESQHTARSEAEVEAMRQSSAQSEREMEADAAVPGEVIPEPPGQHNGPLLLLATDRLHFSTEPNYLAHSPLRATNFGTTAIFYSWKQLPVDAITNSQGDALPFNEKPSTFTLSESHSGVLLPGEEHFFAFSFRSTKPCVTSERWELQTVPSGKDRIVVHLRGVTIARERDPLSVQILSNAFDQRIVESPKTKTQAEEVRNAEAEEPVSEAAAKKASFEAENDGVGVYYSEKIYSDFEAFYASLQMAVHHPYQVDSFYEAPWNGSVADLELQIRRVPFPALRVEYMSAYRLLVSAASHDHAETDTSEWSDHYAYHYALCHDIVGSLVDDVVCTSFGVQEQLGMIEAPPRGAAAKAGKAAKAPPKKATRSSVAPAMDTQDQYKQAFEASVASRVSDAFDQVFDGCSHAVHRLTTILKSPDTLLAKIVVPRPEEEQPEEEEEPEGLQDGKMDKSDRRESVARTAAESKEETEAAATEQDTAADQRDEEAEEDQEEEDQED
eukprot:TRINITY_DN18438_c0_g2_i1.p1 TRINITY_DN18438_c0_g2~~TRINITY_DN18438_c0_g2_i1.p1  ORF type:complete len:703 (+),score=268.67 TRINITY_DN18438_c0_g2_i1:50-2158(+)